MACIFSKIIDHLSMITKEISIEIVLGKKKAYESRICIVVKTC